MSQDADKDPQDLESLFILWLDAKLSTSCLKGLGLILGQIVVKNSDPEGMNLLFSIFANWSPSRL